MADQPFSSQDVSDLLAIRAQLHPEDPRHAKLDTLFAANAQAMQAQAPPKPRRGARTAPPTAQQQAASGNVVQQIFSPAQLGNTAYPGVGTMAQGVGQMAQSGQRLEGATRTLQGAGEAFSPMIGPAAVEAPVGVAATMAAGQALDPVARRGVKAMGGPPQAQEFAGEAAQWIVPGAYALGRFARVTGGAITRPGKGYVAEAGGQAGPEGPIPGTGKVQAGVAQTPEGVKLAGKVGPYKASVTIPGTKPKVSAELPTAIVARHGETVWDEGPQGKEKIAGGLPLDIDERGIAGAKKQADDLQGKNISHVATSPVT